MVPQNSVKITLARFDFNVHQRVMCHVTPQTLPNGASLLRVHCCFRPGPVVSCVNCQMTNEDLWRK